MPAASTFTCLTEWHDFAHVSQELTSTPEEALAAHFRTFPYDEGDGRFEEEIEWLLEMLDRPQLLQVRQLGYPGVWLWMDGLKRQYKCQTYLVRTAID